MKKMKLILASAFALAFSLGVNAQDINEAVELYNKAKEAYTAKNYQAAIPDFEKAYEIAISVSDAGEAGETIKSNCKNLIPDSYSSIGETLASEKKYSEALDYFKKTDEAAAKYGTTDAFKDATAKNVNKVYSGQAVDYAQDGDIEKAIETAKLSGNTELLEKINKVGANSFLKKASAASSAKNYAEVISNAQKALEYDSDNATAYLLIGNANYQSKNYTAAIPALEKAASLGNAQSYYLLGAAYQQTGNKAKAIQNFKKVTGNNAANAKKMIDALSK